MPYDACCVTRGIIPDEHYGIDLGCNPANIAVGTMGDGDLVASCDGQAEGGDWTCSQGGNYVLIKYIVGEQPLYVYYYHLVQGSVTKVPVGSRLKKGDQVGVAGNTGYSFGIHLDVTSQTTPPLEIGKYDPASVVDFRTILDMNNYPACE